MRERLSLSDRLRAGLNRALGLISPTRCRLCEQPAEQSVCAACYTELPHQRLACAQCALPFADSVRAEGVAQADTTRVCGECLAHPPPFVSALAPFRYQAPITQMISRFKYQGVLADGRLLGTWLGDYVQTLVDPVDLIIPVPLHPTRLRQRGFNQSAELAHWVSRIVQVPWRADILQRVQAGPEQQGLPRSARQRNMRGVFQVVKVPAVTTVALVDDVVTTGATVRAAADCLRRAGVARVVVWAVARTPKPGMG